MEVDPPTSNNITLQHHSPGASSGYASRDLESTMNNANNNGIPTPGILKRCSSAPMINILVSTAGMQIRYDSPEKRGVYSLLKWLIILLRRCRGGIGQWHGIYYKC